MKISNSQIQSFQKCEKRFYFEHILKLKPLTYPEAMEKGIFGHRMMEYFFKAMQEGKSYEDCCSAINPLIEEAQGEGAFELLKVYKHVLAFGYYAFQQEWRVVSVEESRLAPLAEYDNEHEYAFTTDVIFEWTVGPKRGLQFIIDFKFTGQYWNDREVNMFQQLPKYIVYTNELDGKNIRHAGIVMLNTRAPQGATGSALFLVKWIPITKEKLQRIKHENEQLVGQIAHAKKYGTPEGFFRTVDAHQCKMCFFADDLCPAELEGRPTDRIIKRNYEVNTYFDQYEDEDGSKTT